MEWSGVKLFHPSRNAGSLLRRTSEGAKIRLAISHPERNDKLLRLSFVD
jgi:hypothetical protein